MFEREFKDNFSQLGVVLLNWLDDLVSEPLLDRALALSYRDNPFFTPAMQRHAVKTIAQTFLVKSELERWLKSYPEQSVFPCPDKDTVGVIMAGNIPLVGFHDFLCVMASRRRGVFKLSSKDQYLLPAVFELLCRINPFWRDRVQFTESIKGNMEEIPDRLGALVSTGSDATKQAVSQEYAGLPMLLRGRRFSFAVLSGSETNEDLEKLAEDVFLYYGLGCRNVTYFLVPSGYDFGKLIKSFSCMRTLDAVGCYRNIYKRGKAILLMEGEIFIDGGFFLLKMTENVYPSIAELGYMEYASGDDILEFENQNNGHIQKKYCTFGLAQAPLIDEYADGIDVMDFIFNHTCAYK